MTFSLVLACFLTSGCSCYEILAYSTQQMFVGHWLCIRGNPWHSNAHPSINHLLRGHSEPEIRRKDSREKICFPRLRFHGPAERKWAIIIITQMLHAITVGVQAKFHRWVLKGGYRFCQTTGGIEMHCTTKRCDKMWNSQGTQKYFVQVQCMAHGRVGWGKDKDLDNSGTILQTNLHSRMSAHHGVNSKNSQKVLTGASSKLLLW